MSRQVLRFSIGPVQGFIAQARRTRDLWAGSFLLSWLAGHAMAAVRAQDWTVSFPDVREDPLVAAIERRGRHPLLATVPNQFKAEGEGDGFDPDKVVGAVRAAWRRVAAEVYAQFVRSIEGQGNGTADIWREQVDGFWEIQWVLGEADGREGGWLEARKAWRSHRTPDQGGERCTLMGDWQELSGFGRLGDRARRDAFWDALRGSDSLDLRDGERLCAMALIKRLFPRLAPERLERAIGWIPGGDPGTTVNWPSTGHVAAARWLAAVSERPEVVAKANDMAAAVDRLSSRHFGEQRSRLRSARQAAGAFAGGEHSFATLDSSFLRLDDLMNPRTLPLFDRGNRPVDPEPRASQRTPAAPQRLELRALHRAVGDEIARTDRLESILPREPPSYYALLLMDGDHVGRLLDGRQDQNVSQALTDFTQAVADTFGHRTGVPLLDGVPIYAGGDDVLALIAVEEAIGTASALAEAYRAAFQKRGVTTPEGGTPDISAAIVFADHHEPFRDVLALAHRLLDRAAKAENGRASLAIGVQKPSGLAAQWAGKWRLPGCEPPRLLVEQAAESGTASRFPYLLRARYIAPAFGRFADIGFTNAEIAKIFEHELGQSVGKRATREGTAAALRVLARPRTPEPYDAREEAAVTGLDEAGLLVARFLSEYRGVR